MLPPWELYQRLDATSSRSFFLDSTQYRSCDQRYSYMGADPFLEVTLKNHRVEITGKEKGSYPEHQFVPILRRLLKKYKTPSRSEFFNGGAVGFLGYEMAPLFDRVKFRSKPDPGTPQAYFGFFRDVIVYDHAKAKYYGLKSKGTTSLKGPGTLREVVPFAVKHFYPEISKSRFEAMVRKAKRYIEAGDIYQANLSQRFAFEFEGSPLKLYDALRQINPSPFASYFNLGDLKIISSSPERLVSKKGNRCETRPIAGTRPQSRISRTSKKLEKDLRVNPKEVAEHIMLVDLERNDLGRVCDYNSVRVEELMGVEKYSHVMHLVSKITGKLQKGKDAFDLIKAVFPGGTVTGCPKIRCMEVIDELEPVKRGLYTGSIGYIDFNGDMDLNIVIRTLILQKKKGYLQVGAGIVYDSDPTREYEETLHKGEALVQALVEASL